MRDNGLDLRRGHSPDTGLQSGPRDGPGGGFEEGAVIFPDRAVRILIATNPVDFRKGHDGLEAMAHTK